MKITTKEEYENAIEHVDIAFQQTEYWQEKLDYWSRAIEAYEDIHYPMDKPSLWARIKFRLGQRFGWLGWRVMTDETRKWMDEFMKSNKKLDEAWQKIRELERQLIDAQIAKHRHNRLAETKAWQKRCQWRERLHPPIDYDDAYYGDDV